MKMRVFFSPEALFLLVLLVSYACTKDTETQDSILTGMVTNMSGGKIIHPAYIIMEDTLLAVTDEDGMYETGSLKEGIYSLVCSSLDYGDLMVEVVVEAGKPVYQDFQLLPDDSKGRIYGEFHDQILYDAQLISNPSMADWSAREMHDGVSGATLQTMTFGNDLPASEVYLGDSLISLTDGFGQYWFDIQCGTYPLTGSADAYNKSLKIVKVEPDSRTYANFILMPTGQ